MLNPRLSQFRYGDSVRQLHARYGSLDPSALSVLWQLFLEIKNPLEESPLLPTLRNLLPDAEQDRGIGHQAGWLRTVFPAEEVRLPLVAFRKGALSFYIEAAALRVDTRTKMRTIRRQLQTLGGRLARVKNLSGRENESQAIATEIKQQRYELKRLRHWPRLDDPQLWWHWTMVQAYEYLPRTEAKNRVSPLHVKQLCQWLSVSEIGLICTPAAIKAARRRFSGRDWLDNQYPTYLATPRRPTQSSVISLEHEGSLSPEGDRDPIQFTCHVCHFTTTGTLLTLGKHLREQHQIQLEHVELSETEQVIRKKGTEEILAAWQELTQTSEHRKIRGSGP